MNGGGGGDFWGGRGTLLGSALRVVSGLAFCMELLVGTLFVPDCPKPRFVEPVLPLPHR